MPSPQPPADRLTDTQIAAAQLADWRKLGQALHARFVPHDLSEAAAFVTAVADVAGSGAPDVHLTGSTVDLALSTRTGGRWVTPADVALARTISDLAARHGLSADPTAVTQVEFGLDTADHERVAPFWSALLTGDAGNALGDSVFDPTDRVGSVWFQGTEAHDTPRQRWHADVWVAPEVAQERIAAAVAAGGTVVDESGAPAFVVLADADGNKACVCVTTGRP